MMKAAVYLTKPEEMRKARLNQPRVTSEEARRQCLQLRHATERFSAAARSETSARGLSKIST
jgi:hypothetical protein